MCPGLDGSVGRDVVSTGDSPVLGRCSALASGAKMGMTLHMLPVGAATSQVQDQ